MAAKKMTFERLIEVMGEMVEAGVPGIPSESIQANCRTALTKFIADHGYALKDQIGNLLRKGFKNACDEHRARLIKEGRSDRYIANRFTYLRHWHCLVRRLDHEYATEDGSVTPLQAALRDLFEATASAERAADSEPMRKLDGTPARGFKIKVVARTAGVPLATLKRWLAGGEPRPDTLHHLTQIERACELEPGSLLDLLPRYAKDRALKGSATEVSAYRARLSVQCQDPYRVGAGDSDVDVPQCLRNEWANLIEYKREKTSGIMLAQPADSPVTALLSEPGSNFLMNLLAVPEESLENPWRERPAEEFLKRKRESWAFIVGERYYPTAQIAWSYLGSFFGWAHLPRERGGLQLPVESLTLGLLMDHGTPEAPGRLIRYLSWRVSRSAGINSGTMSFLKNVMMLCHPRTGFLLRHPEIGAKVGLAEPDEWREHCVRVHRDLAVTRRKLETKVTISRSSMEPIRHQLEHEHPLRPYHDMLYRLHKRRPLSGGIREAEWARDCALVALAMSNPLRAINLRNLTYRPDNTGELRKVGGAWRIFIDKKKFKNIRGAAADRDYDQEVDKFACEHIERYLTTYRKTFGTNTDLVFVSSELPNETWEKLSARFSALCRLYLDRSPGAGIHSIRHIVATHTILVTNGDFAKAAMYLHDKPATVEKHYAHLLAVVADRARREVNNRFMRASSKSMDVAQPLPPSSQTLRPWSVFPTKL